MFSQTLVYTNSKNEIRQRNWGRREAEKNKNGIKNRGHRYMEVLHMPVVVDGARLGGIQAVSGVRRRNQAQIGNGILKPLARNKLRHRPELMTCDWSCQLEQTNDKLGTMLFN